MDGAQAFDAGLTAGDREIAESGECVLQFRAPAFGADAGAGERKADGGLDRGAGDGGGFDGVSD